MKTIRFFFVGVLTFFLATCEAQTTLCSGTLTGTFSEIVVQQNDDCTLDRATVTGSVIVNLDATLTTRRRTTISGSVEATNSGDILIGGRTTVDGSVLFEGGSATLEIDTRAVVTSVSIENAGSLILRGTAGNVESKNSGAVEILGGSTTGGGLLVEQGTGDVTLCGADLTGGVSFTERSGNLNAVSSGTCDPSTITGSIGIEKGTGDVLLTGATITNGDLSVVEQTGRIEVSQASLSDVGIEKGSGPIILTDITTDSDVSIKENTGDVQILDSSFTGDIGIEQNAAVDIQRSDFAFESVGLKLNTGPVTFIDNTDLSVSFEENDDVEIRGNTIVGAVVSKNTGGVSIVDNTFDTISCVDNRPRPTGSGNTVNILAEGQCRNI